MYWRCAKRTGRTCGVFRLPSLWGTFIPFQLPYRFFHFGEAGARFGLFIAVLLQHCRDPRLQLETCCETSSAYSTRSQGSTLGKAEAEAGDCSVV
jgi:hypothetical protein